MSKECKYQVELQEENQKLISLINQATQLMIDGGIFNLPSVNNWFNASQEATKGTIQ